MPTGKDYQVPVVYKRKMWKRWLYLHRFKGGSGAHIRVTATESSFSKNGKHNSKMGCVGKQFPKKNKLEGTHSPKRFSLYFLTGPENPERGILSVHQTHDATRFLPTAFVSRDRKEGAPRTSHTPRHFHGSRKCSYCIVVVLGSLFVLYEVRENRDVKGTWGAKCRCWICSVTRA